MTLADRLDSLLDAVRAGGAPPSFIVGVRNESERAAAEQLLRGRKGRDAIDVQISDDPRCVYHEGLAP
jgi:hypothetical protein